MFKTKIIEVGKSADYFRGKGLVVLFSEAVDGIPMDYSYKINKKPVNGDISSDMSVYLNDEPYRITAVGKDVFQNLNEYGHITMRFDGSTEANMPGTLYLEEKELPMIDENMEIEIR